MASGFNEVTFDFGGMYSSGTTTQIELLADLFEEKCDYSQTILESSYCNVLNFDDKSTQTQKIGGIKKFIFEDENLEVIIAREWVWDNDGRIVYENVVGPRTSFLSELTFLTEEVLRKLISEEEKRKNGRDKVEIIDVAIECSKVYFRIFGDLCREDPETYENLHVPPSERDLELVENTLGVRLKDYNDIILRKRLGILNGPRNKFGILEKTYESPPRIVKGADARIINHNTLRPDHYFMYVLDPAECVRRAEGRGREETLCETHLEYPTALYVGMIDKHAELAKNPLWSVSLTDTTHIPKEVVFDEVISVMIPIAKKKNVLSLESVLNK
jgi:hypothetical protein